MKKATLNPHRTSRRGDFGPAWLRSALDAAQRRFRRARPGSILILVVALLVLLALIGTAFITTTGSDRVAAAQNVANVEADMLVDGVIKMALDQLMRQVAPVDPPIAGSNSSFRPATPANPSNYAVNPNPTAQTPPLQYTDVVYGPWDAHLADRYPIQYNNSTSAQDTPLASTGTNLIPAWHYISVSPFAKARDPAYPQVFLDQFVSPLVTGTTNVGTTFGVAPPLVNAPVIGKWHSRAHLVPCSVQISINGVARKYPAFQIGDTRLQSHPNPTVSSSFRKVVLAADTDGDGIADAGLFELPVGQINGVRYYAAMRIIDNSAAINASIAWEPMPSAALPASDNRSRLQVNVFPTNIDLFGLMQGPTTTNKGPDYDATFANQARFNSIRFGGLAGPSLMPIRDTAGAANFQFATQYDAFWFGLGARFDNPGFLSGTTKYRALGIGESAGLAYRFCLANPMGAQSEIERQFPNGFRNLAAINMSSPYDPSQYRAWFQNIFNYDYLSTSNPPRWAQMPLRPLVVGHNTVNNFVPSFTGNSTMAAVDPSANTVQLDEVQRAGKYRYRGVWAAGQLYHIGEWVRAINSNGQKRAFVCIQNHTAANSPATGPSGANLAEWAEVPWFSHPVRINPNTASFGQLMAAFNAVMGDAPEAKPAGVVDPAYADNTVYTFGNMNRPLGGNIAQMPPKYVKQLRAALAAVNLLDIRDADNDVTSRTVKLANENGGDVTTVQVYGTEKQPYITEAMVHITAENLPYVAVELYNPYPFPIQLSAFRLAYRSRMAGGPPVLIDTLNGKFPGNTIPAFGWVYVENNANRRGLLQNGAAFAGQVVEIPGIEQVLGDGGTRELLLLRTRRYDGNASSSTDPANVFDESNTQDLIPSDLLEFTGITMGLNAVVDPASGMPIPIPDRYHYRRATRQNSGNFTNHWHCVFAGPYNRAATADFRRQVGWVRDQRPNAAEAQMSPPVEHTTMPGWGDKDRPVNIPLATDPGPSDKSINNFQTSTPKQATFRTRTLQVNAAGFGGPYRATLDDNGTNYKFPAGVTVPVIPCGGFLRTGDMLQTTFVGAYAIKSGETVLEMNSLSMDAVWAEDGDQADDDEKPITAPIPGVLASPTAPVPLGAGNPVEQLGRFCPFKFTPTTQYGVDDYTNKASIAPLASHRYAWAMDLFDYFSVICPQDDYMPNVDPNVTPGGDPTVSGSQQKWPFTPQPQPVGNNARSGTNPFSLANHGLEDAVPIHGQINLNTANWRVLAQIPFTANQTTNQTIAHNIVTYRETVGPIRSLFELNKVTNFQDAVGVAASLNPNTLTHGDVTPLAANANFATTDDGVAGDFEARYGVLTRISNMVTTKSDSFTVYVMVQGWRNPGTTAPELVVQRRGAVIVDRSTMQPLLPDVWVPGKDLPVEAPTVITVPNN